MSFHGSEPSVLTAREKRREEQPTGRLMNHFTSWALASSGGKKPERPGQVASRLSGVAFQLDSSLFSHPLGRGQRKKTTCFFINDALCRVRLSTD